MRQMAGLSTENGRKDLQDRRAQRAGGRIFQRGFYDERGAVRHRRQLSLKLKRLRGISGIRQGVINIGQSHTRARMLIRHMSIALGHMAPQLCLGFFLRREIGMATLRRTGHGIGAALDEKRFAHAGSRSDHCDSALEIWHTSVDGMELLCLQVKHRTGDGLQIIQEYDPPFLRRVCGCSLNSRRRHRQ
jgi:hypothetical protein